MKIKINTTEFKKSISKVDSIITSRELHSIYSTLHIKTGEDEIFITSTDLQITIKNTVEADVIEEGSVCIPSKQLSSIINNLNFENILLEVKQSEEEDSYVIYIKDADGKYKYISQINGMEPEDIATIPDYKLEQLEKFDSDIFKDMLDKVFYAVAKDDSRHIFNGLLLEVKDKKLIFVGTNGRRLCKVSRDFISNTEFGQNLIIPHKAISEFRKIMNDFGTGYFGIIEDQLLIKAGDIELLCKLIEGRFPDYEDVIPTSNNKTALVPKLELQLALKQATSTAEEPTKQIIFTFSKNNLNVYSISPGVSETSIDIDLAYEKDESKLAFKSEYLTDVFRCIQDDFIKVEFTDSVTPVVFLDNSDSDFIAVVAPMKI